MRGDKRHGFCCRNVRFVARDRQEIPENGQIILGRPAEPDPEGSRHCERSEAISGPPGAWPIEIASSLRFSQ